jgi:hypothetical protein
MENKLIGAENRKRITGSHAALCRLYQSIPGGKSELYFQRAGAGSDHFTFLKKVHQKKFIKIWKF